MGNQVIDKLSITHFSIYFVIGLFMKNQYIFILFVGIMWEIFEYNIIQNEMIYNLLDKYWIIPKKYWEEKNKYNRYFDILFNILGYMIGNKIKIGH
tara:strand:- start:9 stop:296 length:288 start_codon:yes stop_codon:yes gene_type:complete